MDGEAPVFHGIRLFSVSIRRHLFILSKLLGNPAPVIARVSSHIYGGDGHGKTAVTNHQRQGPDRLATVGCDHDWMVRWCGWRSTCGGAEFNSQTITYRRTLQQRRSRLCLVMEIRVWTFVVAFLQRNKAWRKVVNQLPLRVFPWFNSSGWDRCYCLTSDPVINPGLDGTSSHLVVEYRGEIFGVLFFQHSAWCRSLNASTAFHRALCDLSPVPTAPCRACPGRAKRSGKGFCDDAHHPSIFHHMMDGTKTGQPKWKRRPRPLGVARRLWFYAAHPPSFALALQACSCGPLPVFGRLT